MSPRTTIIDNGEQQVLVGEHPDRIFLSLGGVRGAAAAFLNPIHALEVAAALTLGASRVIERQFQQQLGGS